MPIRKKRRNRFMRKIEQKSLEKSRVKKKEKNVKRRMQRERDETFRNNN